MNEILAQRARAYAEAQDLQLLEQLGYGMHGIVYVAENNRKTRISAVKIHESAEPYDRERRAYERLAELSISEVEGFHVPQLIGSNDEFRAIEMTIVTRPFLLDFASAYLDRPPEFPDMVWQEWEEEKREQFGTKWPTVENAIEALKVHGVYLLDVSPSNIAFLD